MKPINNHRKSLRKEIAVIVIKVVLTTTTTTTKPFSHNQVGAG